MPYPFPLIISAAIAIECQKQWLEFWFGQPRTIRFQAVVLNLDDFRKIGGAK